MNIIPKVKKFERLKNICNTENIMWYFADETDERVIKAAERISKTTKGLPVYISHKNKSCEEYILSVAENEIKIDAESAAGAFYALMTLKMMMKSSENNVPCCVIKDSPDMAYRGFYQDTTRGRIPTLDTLKKLADTMAEYKMNSLQLYVEHSFDFKEYKHCNEQLGYLTKEEVKELDEYCKERFIELIPSLSCFGHLYHLLQSEQYKHLCELSEYKPAKHYWYERMHHHTINPLLDESFEVVTSLIEQHMSAFSSDKFNICCDETFDLGKDVNKDKDKGELYIGFVKKLIEYLEAKGKIVMMWGDIVLQYPERISELSDKLIFLNWEYGKEPNELKISALKNRTQYVCPGTSSWYGFSERVDIEEDNITNMAKYGIKYNATGILNTNWGDLGNPASIDMAMYGMILGAAVGWNIATEADGNFRKLVGAYYYGNEKAVELLADLSEAAANANWSKYHIENWDYEDESKEAYENAQAICEKVIDKLKTEEFADYNIKNEFLIAAQGYSLLIKWGAVKKGYNVTSKVNFDEWLSQYEKNWLRTSKQSELGEMITMLKNANE